MEGSIGKDEIVATTKFKPSSSSIAARQKKQQDDVVDDWDAESSDEDTAPMQQKDAAETSTAQVDVFRASKDEWTSANSQAPTAVPLVVSGPGRTLPGSAYGQRVNARGENGSIASSPYAGSPAMAEPPRILQRPRNVAPGVRSDGTSASMSNSSSQERKTVEQRQEEYRLARERIFGTPTNASGAPSKGRPSKQ
ncbi:uncharacterized protein PAN0_002c1001 [Moesziomyces antarcticus]|uniref:SUZ domain-containing protein n=1 Tax=Pseudozyma antarctica TaxID=84753 RepID=A0A5C3FIX8_PSEA2|nr:uncharacterized protein PAN0_002c1001 [Moesziomyces antarcticus]GAK62799.1 conserved hypothetical protein [Moesziomyces antarcticus]SPO43725.1 uncharacterized protein PSANT_01410 [Moesziomyces antarcticus]